MIGRSAGHLGLDTVEPKLGKIEFVHKDVDPRTGLSSPIQSPRQSGNSVLCPRSVPSTKRLIRSPAYGTGIISRRIKSSGAFLHNQGQTRTSSLGAARPLPPSADIGPGGQSVGQAAQFCLGWSAVLCSTEAMPVLAPKCFGSAAIVSMVSAET